MHNPGHKQLKLFYTDRCRCCCCCCLQTQEVTQLLLDGGVDFRDCFERSQLIGAWLQYAGTSDVSCAHTSE